jgi:hypothetical protein
VGAPLSEVRAEAVAADVLHALLVRYGRHGACWVVFAEGLVEEAKVGEAAADVGDWFLEGGEGGLSRPAAVSFAAVDCGRKGSETGLSHICGDQV